MKLLSALAGLLCLSLSTDAISPTGVDKFHATKDYIGNTMWLFGDQGVYMYSPDGQQLKNFLPSESICGRKEDHDGPSYRYCRFNDIVSDGKKYVWAALSRAKPTIDVFDIDTGSVVGSFDTCHGPRNLEYHALRDEVWVRCSDIDVNSTMPTNLDVISASNPAGDIQADILLKDRALTEGLSSSGYSVIHHTLGDVGYLTDSKLPYIFKVDLSTKKVIDKIELAPASEAVYEAVYSPMNKHIFLRAVMCCTCGFDGADLGESCGRRPGYDVNPTTGPFAGQIDVMGVCGSSCEKKGIDTIGVYEFDTGSDRVVATHIMKEGMGGDPYPSPDGKYIILLGRNGGKTIRIIETGDQGLASRTLIDLELDFNRTGFEDKSVSKDFAFVYKNGKTLVVFPSGTDHQVAIVELASGDLTNANIPVDYVTFNPDEFIQGRAPHGRYRRIEWAADTNYVWVNDYSLDETYVIDVINKKVETVLTDIDTSSLVSVQNYKRARQIETQKDLIAQMTQEQEQPEQSSSSGTAIVAIIVGAVAVVGAIANFMYMVSMKKSFEAEFGGDMRKNLNDLEKSSVADESAGGLNSIN